MLESIEHIGTEALVVIGVFLVGDVLDEHRGVEVDERARKAPPAVFGEVDRCERSVGAVALTHHSHSSPPSGVRIEIICFLPRGAVSHLHEVGGIHGVPLSVDIVSEDGTLVAPLAQVLYRCRPETDVVAAIGGVVDIVRAHDVGPVLSGVVGVFENPGLTIGQMLPKRKVGILCIGCREGKKHE